MKVSVNQNHYTDTNQTLIYFLPWLSLKIITVFDWITINSVETDGSRHFSKTYLIS